MPSDKLSKYIKTWRNLQGLQIILWQDEDGKMTNRIALSPAEFELLFSITQAQAE